MLEISGPQLNPLAQILHKFDRRGFVPDIYNQPGDEGIIVLSYPHRTYNERYFISPSGIIERKDVI
jgi:hypothetical protein